MTMGIDQPTTAKSDIESSSIDPTASSESSPSIQQKNRRRAHLARHPSYLSSPNLEVAAPLLHDRCIRRFQTEAERQAEGKRKGFAGVLETDLWRGEAKLAALSGVDTFGASAGRGTSEKRPLIVEKERDCGMAGTRDEVNVPGVKNAPTTREEGLERWREEMSSRFIRGEDDDFDYITVDDDVELDAPEMRREEAERWFEDEEPDGQGEGYADSGVQDF